MAHPGRSGTATTGAEHRWGLNQCQGKKTKNPESRQQTPKPARTPKSSCGIGRGRVPERRKRRLESQKAMAAIRAKHSARRGPPIGWALRPNEAFAPRPCDCSRTPIGQWRLPPLSDAPKSLEMPEVGLEPTHPCGHWILSPARLPFRHSGAGAQPRGQRTRTAEGQRSELEEANPVHRCAQREPTIIRRAGLSHEAAPPGRRTGHPPPRGSRGRR